MYVISLLFATLKLLLNSRVPLVHLGVLDILMMYGAYSTSRRMAVSRIFLRFIWFGVASVFVCLLYV